MGQKFRKGRLRRSPESMISWQEGQVTGPDKAEGERLEVGDKGRVGSLSLRGSGKERDMQQKA